jgi:2-dehydro-3-deoxygalactonokinase
LRAEGLLNGLSPVAARSRLSGLMIGLELAAAKPYWLGQRIALIGAEALSTRYASALTAQGAVSESLDATACTLAGLAAARGVLQKAKP